MTFKAHILKPLLAATVLACTPLQAAPFGNKDDIEYANKLWETMEKSRLVGEKATISTPYKGVFPHGDYLDTLDANIIIDGHEGRLIIKRNYGGKGITKEMVANNPLKYLKAVTVMYKREKGYDSENLDWFWVKYNPNGEVLKNPKGIPLAGRVAKGNKNEGCISCHTKAPGKDMVYNNDRF